MKNQEPLFSDNLFDIQINKFLLNDLIDLLILNIKLINYYRHPIGFLYLDLTDLFPKVENIKYRLHLWDNNEGYIDNMGEIHTHIWHLKSRVLAGCLEDSLLEPIPSEDGNYFGSRIQYGDENIAHLETMKYSIRLIEKRKIEKDMIYEIPAGFLHYSTLKTVPTLTLVKAEYDITESSKGPLVLNKYKNENLISSKRIVCTEAEVIECLHKFTNN